MTTSSTRRRATSASLPRRCAREFPQYASYFSIEGLSNGKQVIPSHNNLLGRFEGADGMKTGYTCPAGYNLVASATRDGRTLMAIVIGATSVKSRNEAAAGLLAKGFSQPTAGGADAGGAEAFGRRHRPGDQHARGAVHQGRKHGAAQEGARGSLPSARRKASPSRPPILPSAKGRGTLSRSASAARPARRRQRSRRCLPRMPPNRPPRPPKR